MMKWKTRGSFRIDSVPCRARTRTSIGMIEVLKFRHWANVGRYKENCKVDKRTHPKSAKGMINHICVSNKNQVNQMIQNERKRSAKWKGIICFSRNLGSAWWRSGGLTLTWTLWWMFYEYEPLQWKWH